MSEVLGWIGLALVCLFALHVFYGVNKVHKRLMHDECWKQGRRGRTTTLKDKPPAPQSPTPHRSSDLGPASQLPDLAFLDEPDESKICRDCIFSDGLDCTHPSNTTVDLVYGDIRYRTTLYNMRNSPVTCGPTGRFYKAKE